MSENYNGIMPGQLIKEYLFDTHCQGSYGSLWAPDKEEVKKFLQDVLDVMDSHNGGSNVLESEKVTLDQVFTTYTILEQRRNNNLAVRNADARDELCVGFATVMEKGFDKLT